MRKLFLAIIPLLAAAASCVYPFEPEIIHEERNLVIEGDILVGAESTVTLSYMSYLDEKTSDTVPAGQVCVQSLSGREYAARSESVDASGRSFVIDLSSAPADDGYRLSVILRDGREYASEWLRPRVAPIIDDVTHEASDDAVKFNLSLHSDDGEQYFRWTFDEDWEYRTYYKAEYYYVPPVQGDEEHPNGQILPFSPGQGTRYCWKKGSSTALMLTTTKELSSDIVTEKNFYRIDADNQKLSILYAMNVKAESLSEDAYRYWKNMSSNSDNVGNLFAPIPSEMRGNIRSLSDTTELVLGYINVSMVAQKRIFVDNDVTGYYTVPWKLADDEVSQIIEPEEWKSAYYSSKYQYRPVAKGEGSDYYWAPIKCVDCRYQGGTKDKPSYWPNNHY